jgi:chemotaxis protein methyltransferase CheR
VAPPEQVSRFFVQLGANKVRVKDEVRSWVTFEQVNLLDPEACQQMPKMDAVFCRNVMIYFDIPARRRVLAAFHERLVPGGYLLLGHSENLLNLGVDFELVHLHGDLAYRKPLSSLKGER